MSKIYFDKERKDEGFRAADHLPFFALPELWQYIRPYKLIFFSMIFMNMIVGVFDIILPLFSRYAIDTFITEKELTGMGSFILLYLLFLCAQVCVNTISALNCGQIELYVGRDMKKASFDHLQTLSLDYFDENSVGYIHARVMNDTDRISAVLSWYTGDMLWCVCFIIGSIIMMTIINASLALTVIFLIPLITVAAAYFQRKLIILNRIIRDCNSRISGAYNEGISGAKTIKTLVIEERIEDEFRGKTSDMWKYSVRSGHMRGLFVNLITFSGWLALALVLWRGGSMSRRGILQLGTLSVFMTYALKMMDPIERIVECMSAFIQMQVNAERFTRLCNTRPTVTDSHDVIEKYGDLFQPIHENWEPLKGHVFFDDVSFHYPNSRDMVLEHFTLDVPEGTSVAIVGMTGEGKSTLVNLLCRFYEPTSGRILIDGIDERKRSLQWLHSNMGYVLQTPHLFSGTLRENMLYGNENATDDEIRQALHDACADSILERIGLQGQVGEGGDRLSTGQKQLLAIARAVLVHPSLFILDEATSSIDTETEKLVQDAISRLSKGRTSFMIAHRLSTIRLADMIIAIRGGKIIEQGTHEDLMKRRGYYFNLYTQQFPQTE